MDEAAGQADPKPAASMASWAVVICLMAAMIFSMVDRFAISLLVEPIKADLGLSDRDIGLLSGIAFGLFYACMGLPMGVLADRWSRKGTILLGLAVWSAATAACGLARSFYQLLLARIGVGAGEAGLAPASYSIIADLFPRSQLSRALSLFQLGATVGSGIALWVVGVIFTALTHGNWPVLTEGLGLTPWQGTFVVVALPGIPFLALIAILRLPRGRVAPSGARATLTATLAQKPTFYAMLFTAMAGILMVNYALLSWAPAIMQREFHLSPGAVGSTYGLIVLGVCPVAMMLGGWLADRLDRARNPAAHALIVLVSSALVLALSGLFHLATTVTSAYIAIALLHFAVTLPVGVAPALIQIRSEPDVRSRVSALYVLVVNLAGLGIGPVAIGAMSDELAQDTNGLRSAVVLLSAAVSLIAVVAAAMLVRQQRRANFATAEYPQTQD